MAKANNSFKTTIAVTNLTNQLKAAGIIGLTVFFILAAFQPFGTYGYQMKHKTLFLLGYGIICFLIYGSYYTLIMIVFKRWFHPQKWTIIREFLTLIPIVFLMSIASLYYHNTVIGGYHIHLNDIIYFFKISLTIGIVPFSILLYIKWNNSKRVSFNSSNDKKEHCDITIKSNNKKEKPITTALSTLICIKSSGNYVEVTSLSNNNTKTVLIRKSLNQLDGKLPEQMFIKVHRSYIVNKNFIESTYLKGSSYFVKVRNISMEIPLSRSMVKAVRNLIENECKVNPM